MFDFVRNQGLLRQMSVSKGKQVCRGSGEDFVRNQDLFRSWKTCMLMIGKRSSEEQSYPGQKQGYEKNIIVYL